MMNVKRRKNLVHMYSKVPHREYIQQDVLLLLGRGRALVGRGGGSVKRGHVRAGEEDSTGQTGSSTL